MGDCPDLEEMVKNRNAYIDGNKKYMFHDGWRLFRLNGESFVDCIKQMINKENTNNMNFITCSENQSGKIYQNNPSMDEYWSNTDDQDDGPYYRFGQTVALAGTYPTYAQRDSYYDTESDSDSDQMEYQAYPVEHSEKHSTQAQKDLTKLPSRNASQNTDPKSCEGLRTRSSGPLHPNDMNVTPSSTDRRTKSNSSSAPTTTPAPIINAPPIETSPMPEITPFDA